MSIVTKYGESAGNFLVNVTSTAPQQPAITQATSADYSVNLARAD